MPRAKPLAKTRQRTRNPFALPEVRAALAVIGRKGGRARTEALTAEQLSAIGRKGAEARWGKQAGRRRTRASE